MASRKAFVGRGTRGVFWEGPELSVLTSYLRSKMVFLFQNAVFTENLWITRVTFHTRKFGLGRPRSAFMGEIEGDSAKRGRKQAQRGPEARRIAS